MARKYRTTPAAGFALAAMAFLGLGAPSADADTVCENNAKVVSVASWLEEFEIYIRTPNGVVRRYVSGRIREEADREASMHRIAMLAYLTGDPVVITADKDCNDGTNNIFHYIRVKAY